MPQDALATLLGGPNRANMPLDLDALRQSRLREMQRNRELAQNNPHMAVGATLAELKAYSTKGSEKLVAAVDAYKRSKEPWRLG